MKILVAAVQMQAELLQSPPTSSEPTRSWAKRVERAPSWRSCPRCSSRATGCSPISAPSPRGPTGRHCDT